ncbi:hypothetical protein ACOCJ4_07990 [Knoellia sp. CPCC 206435]|uniref:hypothetical protein n=1 Tax=Knoellia terrae TaxID=3404797 RepID=UPI003B429AAC
MASLLLLAGCTDGGGAGPSPSGDGPRPSASPTRDPAAVVTSAREAAAAARSVVVTRMTQDGDDWTHEDIEVDFTAPPSARVLHVGDDIWTLDLVEGVGYLKDQGDRKSTNRWSRLSEADTAAYLRDVSPEGLLGALDAATSVARPTEATVRDVPATCHAFVLDAARALAAEQADEEGSPGTAPPTTASARLCLDGGGRPVESVVTIGDRVTTSVFSQWGFAVEAMPPPANLVDEPSG